MLWNGGSELFASFAFSGNPSQVETTTKFCACCTFTHYVSETSSRVDPCVAQGAIGTPCQPPAATLLSFLGHVRVQRQTNQ